MAKRAMFFSLSVIFIIMILAYFMGHVPESKTSLDGNAAATTDKGEIEFLSDEYFNDLSGLFKRTKVENDKWYFFDGAEKIAAKAVINKIMNDLEKEPNALVNHKNFNLFFDTIDQNIRKLDSITEEMHFFRNTLNAYSNAPDELDHMIDLAATGKWKLFSAKFHRYNNEAINGALNIKFLSVDGRFEAVYNTGTGKIVVDPANIGTYNYAPGSVNPIKYYNHNKYDKVPWKKWGNIKGFSYEKIIRLKSEHGSEEAKNNYKEVERWIQQRKDELK